MNFIIIIFGCMLLSAIIIFFMACRLQEEKPGEELVDRGSKVSIVKEEAVFEDLLS